MSMLHFRRGTHCGAAAGVYLFNTFLRRVELRRLFFNLTLIGVAAGFTQLILVTGGLSCNRILPHSQAVKIGFCCHATDPAHRCSCIPYELSVLVSHSGSTLPQ